MEVWIYEYYVLQPYHSTVMHMHVTVAARCIYMLFLVQVCCSKTTKDVYELLQLINSIFYWQALPR